MKGEGPSEISQHPRVRTWGRTDAAGTETLLAPLDNEEDHFKRFAFVYRYRSVEGVTVCLTT